MANPEVEETESCVRKAVELKKELQRLVKAILDEDDYGGLQVTNEALRVLSCLKDLKLKKPHSFKGGAAGDDHLLGLPYELRCPISGEIMTDPVVLANGQVVLQFTLLFILASGCLCNCTDGMNLVLVRLCVQYL